jgi:hypothetical protein
VPGRRCPWNTWGCCRRASPGSPCVFVGGLLDLSGACVIGASPPECFRYLDDLRSGALELQDHDGGLGALTPAAAGMPTLSRFASRLYLRIEPLGADNPWQLLVGVSAGETVDAQRGSFMRMLNALLLPVGIALAAAYGIGT